MRNVNSGWLIRYLHSNGAGFFFIFVYIHMAKALYYGSYRAPRVLLWSIGVVIFLVMIITAFLGTSETCLKWLNMDEFFFNYDASGFEMSPKLKFWLDRLVIKPMVVYEDLQKDEVKERIKSETRKKAGIYGIFNLVTGDFYIGSAISNRFYHRFYRHLIKGLGSQPVSNSVKKYGLDNFAFVILEYFPVEVTKRNNQDLMALETSWIKRYFPSYNILLEAGNSFGYKHSEDTLVLDCPKARAKQRMKDNYSEERKEQVGSINKGKNLSNEVKAQLREKALNRTLVLDWPKARAEEVKNKYRMASSKPVTVYKQDGTIYASFPGIRVMAKHFQCDHKTINKAIQNKSLFKKQFYVKLDDKK